LVYCIPLYSDIDSEHDLIVGVPGSFRKTIKGLHNLALFRQSVEIRNVISKSNYGRLPPWSEFVFRNFPFIVHVALMGLECVGLASSNLEKVWIDPVEYSSELKSAILHLNRRAIPASIYNLPLCLIPRELWSFSKKSISTWKNVYLAECETCSVREQCGGIFETSVKQSDYIRPFDKDSQS
jgi:His-Xaa-Ser system radical SAM maturase HxsC